METVNRPLEGVKIVELANFIAAPSCARYLADLGADVIKVEAPSRDPLRAPPLTRAVPWATTRIPASTWTTPTNAASV